MDNKKYYWIKLKTEFFNQDTIDFLLSQKNGCEYVVLYQMLCLKTANNNGILSTNVGEMIVPYDISKISRDTKYFSEDTIRVALELYKQLGLIYEGDNNLLQITGFNEMIGSETKWAEKKRQYRDKQKLLGQSEDIVRQEYRDKSIEYRDIDNKKEINKEKSSCYFAERQWNRMLNGTEIQAFNDFDDLYGYEKVIEAIKISCMQHKCTASYVKGILSKKDKSPKWFNQDIEAERSNVEITEEDLKYVGIDE
jgi:predicted phage replisome organizer